MRVYSVPRRLLDEGVTKILRLKSVLQNIHLKDKSKVFNTGRIEALELENLIEAAKATIISAAARKGMPWCSHRGRLRASGG
jgi:succinate dehydrogenase/fumarate reductase flavoprotein subunit